MACKEEHNEENRCKLKVYSKREKRVPLFITSFSHGELNFPSELKYQCFKETGEHTIENEVKRSLVATGGRLHYTGTSYVSFFRYFVGVRDKMSGKMKLYDCVVFQMKPNLQLEIKDIKPVSRTYKEGLEMLTESFGSKARKRVLSLKQKCTVDASLMKEISVNSSDLQPSENKSSIDDSLNSIDYLPPINRVASCVNDVFKICHIISSEEDDTLSMEAQELLTAPLDKFTRKRFSFCKYVSMRFENQLKYADIRKINPTSSIPHPYKKKMLEKFTVMSRTNNGKFARSFSSHMKDKLVSYILVLGLLIDEFNVNLEEIVQDLSNIRVPKLTAIAEAIGCYITKRKFGEQLFKYAELRIPLNVPLPKYVRRSSVKKKLEMLI